MIFFSLEPFKVTDIKKQGYSDSVLEKFNNYGYCRAIPEIYNDRK